MAKQEMMGMAGRAAQGMNVPWEQNLAGAVGNIAPALGISRPSLGFNRPKTTAPVGPGLQNPSNMGPPPDILQKLLEMFAQSGKGGVPFQGGGFMPPGQSEQPRMPSPSMGMDFGNSTFLPPSSSGIRMPGGGIWEGPFGGRFSPEGKGSRSTTSSSFRKAYPDGGFNLPGNVVY